MTFSERAAKWIRVTSIMLIVIGGALLVRALNADAQVPVVAYVGLVAGVVGIVLSRRTESEAEAGD